MAQGLLHCSKVASTCLGFSCIIIWVEFIPGHVSLLLYISRFKPLKSYSIQQFYILNTETSKIGKENENKNNVLCI